MLAKYLMSDSTFFHDATNKLAFHVPSNLETVLASVALLHWRHTVK